MRSSSKHHASAEHAAAMIAWMKGHFQLFGIKAPQRCELVKEHIGPYEASALNELPAIARSAFAFRNANRTRWRGTC